MEKGAGIYSLNVGSLNPVSGVLLIVHNTHTICIQIKPSIWILNAISV